jgi:hypothetical protein
MPEVDCMSPKVYFLYLEVVELHCPLLFDWKIFPLQSTELYKKLSSFFMTFDPNYFPSKR